MKAQLLLRESVVLAESAFTELRIWRVPQQVRGSQHDLKYALANMANRVCVLRSDNEVGKGNHRHIGDIEAPYEYTTPKNLLADFWGDVDGWRSP